MMFIQLLGRIETYESPVCYYKLLGLIDFLYECSTVFFIGGFLVVKSIDLLIEDYYDKHIELRFFNLFFCCYFVAVVGLDLIPL